MKKMRFRTLQEVIEADTKNDPTRLKAIEREKKKLIAEEKKFHKKKR